jgi:hypothetical protein
MEGPEKFIGEIMEVAPCCGGGAAVLRGGEMQMPTKTLAP